jgi:hypothetical protein
MRWRPGEHVVMRYGREGRFDGARPLRIVGEAGGYVAAWLAPGTPTMIPTLEDGRPIRSAALAEQFSSARIAAPWTWAGEGILILIPDRGAHSVWLFWSEQGVFEAWYVNLEQRHRFTEHHIDTCDHVLDLVVLPDRSWRWKDEDEFAAAVDHGWFDRRLAADARREGARVIQLVEEWQSPFADGWERWRPDPSWPIPELPDDWDAA